MITDSSKIFGIFRLRLAVVSEADRILDGEPVKILAV